MSLLHLRPGKPVPINVPGSKFENRLREAGWADGQPIPPFILEKNIEGRVTEAYIYKEQSFFGHEYILLNVDGESWIRIDWMGSIKQRIFEGNLFWTMAPNPFQLIYGKDKRVKGDTPRQFATISKLAQAALSLQSVGPYDPVTWNCIDFARWLFKNMVDGVPITLPGCLSLAGNEGPKTDIRQVVNEVKLTLESTAHFPLGVMLTTGIPVIGARLTQRAMRTAVEYDHQRTPDKKEIQAAEATEEKH
ncbi:SubName: Full=Uncharacterized protein {ECO:0000313/EMBL:CCA67174.1} [Serendipita indica DSM 11827]|uniref:LRAT domain-containing protein n=1 Tax=Serendipita indica (strain DSM 11827) TaxID=1109443 RepID=G4T773_SERID|nr:SubName: Full=Uncharacterized protein {ECO:0000313/EMBL:CCA67174.1} [Serendipita indica DSM 11827]CCA67174.1 hypothetical protein PIIN_01004 [Serendipita indica DSM 11827]